MTIVVGIYVNNSEINKENHFNKTINMHDDLNLTNTKKPFGFITL